MTPREFVENLHLIAVQQVADGELAQLRSPAGRKPSPSWVKRSEWFNGLTEPDQAMVADVMAESAFAALFSVLGVVDGVSVFDEIPHGSLRLVYVEHDGAEYVLNANDAPMLHDELRSIGAS